MTVLAVVTRPDVAARVVIWSNTLKKSGEKVEYVCWEKTGTQDSELALRKELKDEASEEVLVWSTESVTPVSVILDRCRKLKPELLITPEFSIATHGGRPQTSDELVRVVPCVAIYPMFGYKSPAEVKKILMVVSRGSDDSTAIRLADLLRRKLRATVTLATVEDESGTRAERAGERAIRALVHDMGLDEDDFEVKVVVDRIRHRGILSCSEDHDLIVGGRNVRRDILPLRESLKDTFAMIVKRAPPLRLKSLSHWLPRINPSDHADLLQDLRQGSQWNIDFVSMLALASAIASLGLMQNSPAVVIGSMLLAPMMTPMIGAGLAMAQANLPLAKQCMKSIALGFLLTLGVSLLLGLITPSRATLSPEVLSRGAPNVLDLLIALFAAIAATIAMARPGIAGAVAGVAIATALVPPICAIGLSLSMGLENSSTAFSNGELTNASAIGNFSNALGALLLFGTNLIAIIVASSFTFSVLGIVTTRSLPRHQRMIGSGRIALIVLLVLLAGPLTYSLLSQLEQGRAQPAIFPVTRAVAGALMEEVSKDQGVEITFMGRPSVTNSILIHISTNHDLPKSYANKLRNIVRDKMHDPKMKVAVVCLSGQWVSDEDERNLIKNLEDN